MPGSGGPYNTHFVDYGLGFVLMDVKGYKQVSHTGGLEGMVTQITMIPELQLGIIVLTNQEEGMAFTAITNQVKDAYLGITGTDRVAEYSGYRRKQLSDEKKVTDSIWREVAAFQARQAGGGAATGVNAVPAGFGIYTGTYQDPWLGNVVISVKNGKPWFDSKRSPKLTGEMLPYKGNSFIVKWLDRSMNADAYVLFSLDERGQASGMTMKAVSDLTDFSYDFQDLEFHRK
jgi:hypothetical protein